MKTVTAREGRDAARTRRSADGTPPEVTGLLEQVQADHTPADVTVVDEKHRLPAGRPYLTIAIDVCSRCVLGMVVAPDTALSATSVGLCLAHAAASKRPRLERLEAEAAWPMSGKPIELYMDNASEFKSEALRRGCEQHGIRLRYRRPASLTSEGSSSRPGAPFAWSSCSLAAAGIPPPLIRWAGSLPASAVPARLLHKRFFAQYGAARRLAITRRR